MLSVERREAACAGKNAGRLEGRSGPGLNDARLHRPPPQDSTASERPLAPSARPVQHN